jgi:hypothetical protein
LNNRRLSVSVLSKRNAFLSRRKRRANDAIVGAVYDMNYSTIENVVKTNLEG